MFEAATEGDLRAIAALMNRAYRGPGWTSEGDLIAGDRTSVAFLRDEMATRPTGQLLKWVAAGEPAPLGCVWLEPVGTAGVWYLGSFAADPDRQQSGLGKAMLAAAETWVADRGGRRIRMTVIDRREPLIAWYERRGYRRTGEIEPFPYHEHRLGTPRYADLTFVVLEKALGA